MDRQFADEVECSLDEERDTIHQTLNKYLGCEIKVDDPNDYNQISSEGRRIPFADARRRRIDNQIKAHLDKLFAEVVNLPQQEDEELFSRTLDLVNGNFQLADIPTNLPPCNPSMEELVTLFQWTQNSIILEKYLSKSFYESLQESFRLYKGTQGCIYSFNSQYLFYDGIEPWDIVKEKIEKKKDIEEYTIVQWMRKFDKDTYIRHPAEKDALSKHLLPGATPDANIIRSQKSIKRESKQILNATEHKELAAIGTDPARSVTGVVGFIRNYPYTVATDLAFQTLNYRLFDLENIIHLIGHSKDIVSQEIPKILMETIHQLEWDLNSPDTSIETKQKAAIALSHILQLSERFRQFVEGVDPNLIKDYPNQRNSRSLPHCKRSMYRSERKASSRCYRHYCPD